MAKRSSSASKPTAAKKSKGCTKEQLFGVIAKLASLHNGKPPRDLVARHAGYVNAENGSFKKALYRASKDNLIDLSEKDVVWLTELGQAEAGDPLEMETNEQAQEGILKDLSPKMQEVFKLLQDGQAHLRTEIASTLKYENEQHQGFKKLLCRIREKGYLNFVDKDSIQLADICFPNGRDEWRHTVRHIDGHTAVHSSPNLPASPQLHRMI